MKIIPYAEASNYKNGTHLTKAKELKVGMRIYTDEDGSDEVTEEKRYTYIKNV